MSIGKAWSKAQDFYYGSSDAKRALYKKLHTALTSEVQNRGNREELRTFFQEHFSQVGFVPQQRFTDPRMLHAVKATVYEMTKDPRCRSLAAQVEILAHLCFSQSKRIDAAELEDFVSLDNQRALASLLSAFPKEEQKSALKYLAKHPEMVQVCKNFFWGPVLKLGEVAKLPKEQRPFYMQRGRLRVRVQGEDLSYRVKDWSSLVRTLPQKDLYMRELPYRLVQKGLALGQDNQFESLEPWLEVSSQGRCVIQFVSSISQRVPFPTPCQVLGGNTGHRFTQLIVPSSSAVSQVAEKSQVYAFGFFPKNWNRLMQSGPMSTVEGVYKSPDTHCSRIAREDSHGYFGVVKEFEIEDDSAHQPCLLAYASERQKLQLFVAISNHDEQQYKKILSLLTYKREKGISCTKLTKLEKADLVKELVSDYLAMDSERWVKRLVKLLQQHTEGDESLVKISHHLGHVSDHSEAQRLIEVARQSTKEQIVEAVKESLGDRVSIGRSFQTTVGNCVVETNWQQRFVEDFLEASLNQGEPVGVFPSQVAHQDMKPAIWGFVSEKVMRCVIFLGSILAPWTGAGRSDERKRKPLASSLGSPLQPVETVHASILQGTKKEPLTWKERFYGVFTWIYDYVRGREVPSR